MSKKKTNNSIKKANTCNSFSDLDKIVDKSRMKKKPRANQNEKLAKVLSWKDMKKKEYLNKIEGRLDDDFHVTQEYMKHLVELLSDGLYKGDVKRLKNLKNITMRNGIYKALVKDKINGGIIVSVAKVFLEGEKNEEKKMETLDYFISNKKLNGDFDRGDSLFVNINLDKETKKLSVEEFKLERGKTYSVNLTKVGKTGVFICVGKYESFISHAQLKESGCDYVLRDGEHMYIKINNIVDNKKKKGKKWLQLDVVDRPKTTKNIISLDIVKGDHGLVVAA